MKYCPDCGTPLGIIEIDEEDRYFCADCKIIHYQQLKVGAGGLIEKDGKLLLLQRRHEPFKDFWNLPAGYADADEDPYHTVVREVNEETGLKVNVKNLFDIYFFDDDPRGNGIMIVYQCNLIEGKLIETNETKNPTFFAKHELPDNLAGAGHERAILAWKNMKITSEQARLKS